MNTRGCIAAAIALAVGSTAASADDTRITHAMLQDDLRVSQLMDDRAMTEDGKQIGVVHNIMITRDGQLDTVLVEGADNQHYEFAADTLRFYPNSDMMIVGTTSDAIDSHLIAGEPAALRRGSKGAGMLIGLPVDLDGKAPFEQVSDLLINQQNHRLSAYQLQAANGDSHLLPATWDFPDYERGAVQLPLSVPGLVQMDWAYIGEPTADEREAAG